jgi:hypothetical protein
MADDSRRGTGGASTDAPDPPALVDLGHRTEGASALHGPGAAVERLARAVPQPGPGHDAVTGTWLGH